MRFGVAAMNSKLKSGVSTLSASAKAPPLRAPIGRVRSVISSTEPTRNESDAADFGSFAPTRQIERAFWVVVSADLCFPDYAISRSG
jgi:hypothetical protein